MSDQALIDWDQMLEEDPGLGAGAIEIAPPLRGVYSSFKRGNIAPQPPPRGMESNMIDPTNTVAIIGASDPEMAEIRHVLQDAGATVIQAECDGRPVWGGSAYRADSVQIPAGTETVLIIECFAAIQLAEEGPIPGRIVTVDHHRPMDPGFGRPPEEYLEASSLGQVLDLLGHTPTHDQRLIAAADHCLGAAYAGQCPDVDPVILRLYRLRKRAAWLSGLQSDRHEAIAVRAMMPPLGERAPGPEGWVIALSHRWGASIDALAGLPTLELGGHVLLDLRDQEIPELPEALAQSGNVALYRRKNRHDGSYKLGILGAGHGTTAGPEPVEAFLVAALTGTVCGVSVIPGSAYGDPARGYAGVTCA